jgi:hypothetical protein
MRTPPALTVLTPAPRPMSRFEVKMVELGKVANFVGQVAELAALEDMVGAPSLPPLCTRARSRSCTHVLLSSSRCPCHVAPLVVRCVRDCASAPLAPFAENCRALCSWLIIHPVRPLCGIAPCSWPR